MSKRSDKKELKEFLKPSKLSIDEALTTEDPVYEVARRLNHLPRDKLSRIQRNFEGVFYFFGATLSGGFLSSLGSSSGEFFHETEAFAATYCSPELATILVAVKSIFPDAHVPKDQNLREGLLENLTDNWESDPFDEAEAGLYVLESDFRRGLLDYVKKYRNEFANINEAE